MFDAMEQSDHRGRAHGQAAGLPGGGRGSPLRRARGDRHALLRGQGEVDPQRGAAGFADAVPMDDQPVPRLHARLQVLLRAADPQVSRLRRRPGLRARDRGQGQRAGGAAGGAGEALVEGRARGARHQHRPVPVGRGPLQADARDLEGAARRPQPVLDPDEVAAAAAGPRAHAGDQRADGVLRGAVGADARRGGLAGHRAAHAAARGRGSRRSPN